jgi:hypothetical protein
MLDGRFNELHDDTAVIATRVDWVAENAGAAGKKACCVEIGLQTLRRQGQTYESWFATQIARVDHLVAALHEGHFGAGATLADSHRTIMRLVGLVEGCEAHLLSISALRLCFGSWAGACRSAQSSAIRILEHLRYWFRAWHLACAIPRACAAATQVYQREAVATQVYQREANERFSALDDDIEYISDRIAQLPSSVDSDTEHHERCVAIADAAEADETRAEAFRYDGCRALHSRLEPLSHYPW